jgi:hypothetical protein
VVVAEAGVGKTFYDLSPEAQQLGRLQAEAMAKQAEERFPHLSIDHEVDNFLYSPDGNINAWIDPGPCF